MFVDNVCVGIKNHVSVHIGICSCGPSIRASSVSVQTCAGVHSGGVVVGCAWMVKLEVTPFHLPTHTHTTKGTLLQATSHWHFEGQHTKQEAETIGMAKYRPLLTAQN